jgi:lipoate-protein ligase A
MNTFSSSLSKSYQLISRALIEGFNRLDIPAYLEDRAQSSYSRSSLPCFSYPAKNEIKVNEKKIVGSAQKRTSWKFIQHGSIPLERDDQLLESVSLLKQRNEKIRMISVSQALGKGINYLTLVKNLASGIRSFFNVDLNACQLTDKQKMQIKNIQINRHENPKWVYNAEKIDEDFN